MKIVRIPLRVSFFGGGTDQLEYFQNATGRVLSCSISKYIYLTGHDSFDGMTRLSYSKTEIVDSINKIEHPIINKVLEEFNYIRGIEIGSFADIPSKGTGLGSSSAFAVAAIKLISSFCKFNYTQFEIANLAYDLERNKLNDPVGMQDHFGTSIGGLKLLEFRNEYPVKVDLVDLKSNINELIPKYFKLVYTNINRKSRDILMQQILVTAGNKQIRSILDEISSFIPEAKSFLQSGNFKDFTSLLSESWTLKKRILNEITNGDINSLYDRLVQLGSWGGKLLGAGGGGFLLMVAPPEVWEKIKLQHLELNIFDLEIDNSGVIIFEI
jgi:D-glycero-alpha-D-manno-heptose-7-phosphate kinase